MKCLPLKRQSGVPPWVERKVNQYPALLAEIQPARPKLPAADLNCSPDQIIASSSQSGRRRGGRILRDRNH